VIGVSIEVCNKN